MRQASDGSRLRVLSLRQARLRALPSALLATAAATAALALTSVPLSPTATASVPAPATGWTTVWSDDFAGTAGTGVNTASWLYDTGTGYPGGAANWGTNEVETMTSSTANVALDGAGRLAITPVRSSSGAWTSGRIESARTDFQAPAGGIMRVQASIQQPNVTSTNGVGYWPAFWLLGADARPVGASNWPGIGEIDVMEDVNGRSSEFGTLHCGTNPGGPCNETTGLGSGERACGGCQTGFHEYAVELDRSVSPEQLRWYLDGTVFFTLNASQVDATTWANATHHGFFVILNVAMGGAFPDALPPSGPTSATVSGQPMLVDYVAVYTKPGSTSTSTPTPTTTSGGNRDAYSAIQAESYNAQSGVTNSGTYLSDLANGDWARFDNVDFGSTPPLDFMTRAASGAAGGISGLVEVRLDSVGNAPIGSFAIASTGGWTTWKDIPANVSAVTGVHTVFLRFTSGQPANFVNVDSFYFRH